MVRETLLLSTSLNDCLEEANGSERWQRNIDYEGCCKNKARAGVIPQALWDEII
jgi:hypothetical protein